MIKIPVKQVMQNKDFHSVEMDTEEFKKMIEEFINDTYPKRSISDFNVLDDGVSITLDNGEKVEIEIDWNEFVIK